MKSSIKIPVSDLFTDDFISRHSKYQTLAELVAASGVGEEGILTPPFQIYCTYMVDFHDWNRMCQVAKQEYLARKSTG